ncbi:hypothetical protein K8O68_07720 [Salipaludibacillus sp. CUR1]|uniref:hypothetical protein n=1 Tax=Salipaludibacillus sp. CUR1 TaxID=2820003 RepID=UPI001E3F70A4|nr:hypothetical protein [Salipaludibacillus sp. CUR1]MCE7792307.1 hypothetical protein [Salipaludibacillus sp. CUR1]
MENIKVNYQRLNQSYEVASKYYQETGSTHLLKFALEELETFERSFLAHYDIEELISIQDELGMEQAILN